MAVTRARSENGWTIEEAGMAQLDDIVGSVMKKLEDMGAQEDTIVVFTGIWDGDTMHAVTGEVVSKPEKVRWKPESFWRPDEVKPQGASSTCL